MVDFAAAHGLGVRIRARSLGSHQAAKVSSHATIMVTPHNLSEPETIGLSVPWPRSRRRCL